MGSIYAFMVGINDYPAKTAEPLTGCVNDITEARRLLVDRTGGAARIRAVLDGAATVTAVEDGIRTFLGAAGPGDTALFWFSGHGTEEAASGADLLIEATGRNQALVCADGPLPDKRLGALLDAVAARGVHMAAVLDCCYAGGATRNAGEASDLTARFAPPLSGWRTPAGRDVAVPQGPARHVLLAASRLDQPSYEGHFGGRRHGAFTHALLGAVRAAGPEATYRQLLAAADARVQRSGGRQQPVLYPATAGGTADLPFLGGAAAGVPGEHVLRHGAHGWEVDCGTTHGLPDKDGAQGTEFAVVGAQDTGPAPALRARAVHPARTLVDPLGWVPDTERVYPVALSALASAPATVSVEGPGRAGAEDRLRAAVASYGPGGGRAPLVRVVDGLEDSADLHVRLVVEGGTARVLGRDGTAFVRPLPFGADGDARGVVDCLTHLARWHRLRDLTSRPSELDNLVQVEIVPWDAPDGRALVPDGSGEIVRAYGPEDTAGPREPWVSIRLHNRSPRRSLWCVLLDLTDSYAADPVLFPGHFIGPGRTGYALDGDPVQLSLPPDRPAVPGAHVRDWLKLIVAEGELNTAPFQLPAWDPARTGSRTGDARPGVRDDDGVLRFAAPERAAGSREAGRVTRGAPGRWATRTIALRTVVPDSGRAATGRDG
ncbi:caspase domain-containing protein [Streptomyces sp. NPDC014889]|uniref:caspase family protein n=1 Tax=Streptomyces sp. NPDC014889 TaxID=3364928 RepID=UPI003701C3BF